MTERTKHQSTSECSPRASRAGHCVVQAGPGVYLLGQQKLPSGGAQTGRQACRGSWGIGVPLSSMAVCSLGKQLGECGQAGVGGKRTQWVRASETNLQMVRRCHGVWDARGPCREGHVSLGYKLDRLYILVCCWRESHWISYHMCHWQPSSRSKKPARNLSPVIICNDEA